MGDEQARTFDAALSEWDDIEAERLYAPAGLLLAAE